MGNAYIVGAVRTPGGRKNGKLSQWHPTDLGALVLDEIVQRTGVKPELIDDVIFGCVSQSGAQSGNVARNAVLASSLPESVPGTTVDRQCGSSQQAIHFAAQAVMSETQDIVIAGGVEVMSQVPIGAAVIDSFKAGHGQPYGGKGTSERYPGVQFSQFTGAEMMADRWNMTREELDSFALSSHQKAINATEGGHFDREIVPELLLMACTPSNISSKLLAIIQDSGIRQKQSKYFSLLAERLQNREGRPSEIAAKAVLKHVT